MRIDERKADQLRNIDFKLERIKSTIVKSLTGKHNPEIEILKRIKSASQKEKIMNAPARVFINNELSNTQTVLEINGKDRVGLLYFLTTKLTTWEFKFNQLQFQLMDIEL